MKGHVNAIAATEWEGFAVIIMNKSIQIFNVSNLVENAKGSDVLTATTSFNLDIDPEDENESDFVEEATFEFGTSRRGQCGTPLLLFTGRRRDLYSFTGTLALNRAEDGGRI